MNRNQDTSGNTGDYCQVATSLKDHALSVSSEGVVITDVRLPNQPVIYVNDGFQRMTQYSPEEVIGTNCRFLQGPDTDSGASEQIREAIGQRRECTVEILNYRKDGSTFWNRLALTPVMNDCGETTHYIGIQSDVTARRNAEDSLRKANESLEKINRKMKRSLLAASRIQKALLPEKVRRAGDFSFRFIYEPSDELAGDTLNVIPLNDGKVILYTLDVSGHGVQSALLSVTLNHWLSPHSGRSVIFGDDPSGDRKPAAPSRVAEILNGQFQMDMEVQQYFTMLYGVLDTATGRFDYVSAGSPSMVHVTGRGDVSVLEVPGFPVGITDDPGYTDSTVILSPGDRLLIHTDGAEDVTDRSGEFFGKERLLRIMSSDPGGDLDGMMDQLRTALKGWSGNAGPADDVTVLAVQSSS